MENKVEATAIEIMSQLSKEEIISFVQQDYSTLIKILEVQVKLIEEDSETKNPADRVIDEIVVMALDTLKDFLKDINNKGEE